MSEAKNDSHAACSSAVQQLSGVESTSRGPCLRKVRKCRNVLTRMRDEYCQGPLSVLKVCVEEKRKVKVWTRNYKHVRGICSGYVVAFDKHWNMALVDVDETFLNPLPEPVVKMKKKRVRHRNKILQEEGDSSTQSDDKLSSVGEHSQFSAVDPRHRSVPSSSSAVSEKPTVDDYERLSGKSAATDRGRLLLQSVDKDHLQFSSTARAGVRKDAVDRSYANESDSNRTARTNRYRHDDELKDVRFQLQATRLRASRVDGRESDCNDERAAYRRRQADAGAESLDDQLYNLRSSSQNKKGHISQSRTLSCGRVGSPSPLRSEYSARTENSATSGRLARTDRAVVNKSAGRTDDDDDDRPGGRRDERDRKSFSILPTQSDDVKPYQPVLTRHVNQLFLRGDNVVMVALL